MLVSNLQQRNMDGLSYRIVSNKTMNFIERNRLLRPHHRQRVHAYNTLSHDIGPSTTKMSLSQLKIQTCFIM